MPQTMIAQVTAQLEQGVGGVVLFIGGSRYTVKYDESLEYNCA